MEPDLELIRQLMAIAREAGLSELTIESGDHTITVRTDSFSPTPTHYGLSLIGPRERAPRDTVSDEEGESRIQIRSPMIGMFYRSPSPDSPPFVEIGSVVEEGDPIGLVEAMKVFNEIMSEEDGRVVEIPAKNGQLVQEGDILVILERLEDE